MESYFQAAVCDLDKLLDDFEQNTGELESCTAVASTPDVHCHSFSSELLCFKPEIHSPKLQHDKSPATTTDTSFNLHPTAISKSSFEVLNILQKEKNVTGLDLLSTVDGGISDEIQISNLGRGGVPVCDLISDTGKSICTTLSPDSGQEVHPDDFVPGKDYLPILDLSSEPSQVGTPSLGYGASSKLGEPVNGGMTSSNVLHVAVQNLGLVDLKIDGHVSFKPSELCSGDSERTITYPAQENVSISYAANADSNVMLLYTPVETTHPIQKKMPERTDYLIISDEVVLSQKQNTSEALEAEKCVISEERKISFQQDKKSGVEGNNTAVEHHTAVEKLLPSELKSSTAPSIQVSSAPNPSTEKVHSSLSCLPIAVSLCGSLVSTEDADSVMPTNDSRVVHDTVSLHAGLVNNATSDLISYETSEHCKGKEEGPSLNEACQTVVEKEGDSRLSEFSCSEAKDTGGLPHFETTNSFSGIPESEREAVSDMYLPNEDKVYERTYGSVSQNVKSENETSVCDILISDAELDAFLNEQFSNPFEDSLAEIAAIDAGLAGFLHVEDYTSGEDSLYSKNETSVDVTRDVSVDRKVCSTDGSLELINVEYESEEKKLPEPNVSEKDPIHISDEALKHVRETSEVQISERNWLVHGGARPKYSVDTAPQMVCDGEPNKQILPCVVAAGTEQQVSNDEGSTIVASDIETSSDSNTNYNSDGMETNLEAEEVLGSAIIEPATECMKGAALGQKQPSWVPDSEAPNCMNCQLKFTFTKRRHHCRACGKVFCGNCCNRKCKLQYMEKEARVCVLCHESISKGSKEQKRVWFADGVLPNGELADTAKLSAGGKRSSQDHSPVSPMQQESQMVASPAVGTFVSADEPANDETSSRASETASSGSFTITGFSDYRMLCGVEKCVSKDICLLPEDEDGLPPLLVTTGEKGGDAMMEERPCHKQLMSLLEEGGPNPLTFILNANLLVNVKLISYSSEKCWFFSTNGLHALGQAELIIILLCLPNEDALPKDIFKLFLTIYKDALKGKHINNLENVTFNESFLDSKDHGGFLFITPTFQNLEELPLPNTPFLCGILIQKTEVPWAKVFPIRVMLRLGAEYGVYPSPIVSIRNRKPLFGDIGHTIMNLLADLRNYQYTLPNIDGLVIHMKMGSSCIKVPLKRYNEVLKVINSSNEHVISIGANFSVEADSHLVCLQNDDGIYQTQANSKTGQPRKVTGASFVIFNGALKTSSGFLAKSSIVEDGLMVQITPETMEGLRQALREKKDFKIACGKADAAELKEDVNICWVDAEDKTNQGVTSPIDGQSLEGIPSDKIIQDSDFEPDDKLVKCTEVFYLLRNHDLSTSVTYYQFAKEIAAACSSAFCENFRTLKEHGMNRIALRISMDIDMVEYQAGSWGQLLPQHYLNDLDSALIPVIHGRTSDSSSLPLVMELMFFLIENLI